MTPSRIDTHHHFLPEIYVRAVGLNLLKNAMPNGIAPDWSAEGAIAMMDENGIQEGILSVSSGPRIPDAATLLRKCNDYAAELRSRYTGRFGSFASLPLPNIDASLDEVEYCTTQLQADGFILFTNYDGRYLGDPHFAPLLAELDRRRAVAFIHPTQAPHDTPHVAPASVLEYPFETTRTAASLIISGSLRRYPGVRFILSHAGGTLPFLAPRLALSIEMMPGGLERTGDPYEAMRSFYYDTALSGGDAALAALAQVARPDRILFGTDFPFAPNPAIRHFGEVLEQTTIAGINKPDVFRGNAARL